MLHDLLINLLNHDFERLIAVTATESMEVEVQKLQLGLLGEFIDLSDELGGDENLTRRVVSQQVDYLAGAVSTYDIFEMCAKGFLGHL